MSNGANSGTARVLNRYADAAVRLPHPDDPQEYNELPVEVQDKFHQLLKAGVLVRIETSSRENDRFHATRESYEYGQELAASRRTLPCGHGGLRNLGDGRFTCTEEICSEEFDRDTAGAYLED